MTRGAPVVPAPVVLIHGLGRTHRCFRSLRRRLEREGYETWAASYPSMRLSVARGARYIGDRIREELGERPISGVTHSLGGVVARLLADQLAWHRLVMLAPPNSGSRLAAAARRTRLLWLVTGRAGYELAGASGPKETPQRAQPPWPTPPKPFGVIAGTRPSRLETGQAWVGRRLGAFPPGVVHDGTICVEETHHPDMDDFATVPAGHTLLMDHPRTQDLVVRFLATGRFVHAG